MPSLIERINELFPGTEASVMQESFAFQGGMQAVCANIDGREQLVVSGTGMEMFRGRTVEIEKSEGETLRICEMDHENCLSLKKCFSYTLPVAFGRECASIGCGDRLGLAGVGQLEAVKKTEIRPVMAQQSLRELTLTGRSYENVMDAAAWAVFKTGYRSGYGADGDHLKTVEEVEQALAHGMSMITLDCSLALCELPEGALKRRELYERLPESLRRDLEDEYLHDKDAEGLGLFFDQPLLEETIVVYYDAVQLAEKVWELIQNVDYPVDLEISLDETAHKTSLAAHYFVARELEKRKVILTSLAPRFVGEFQKAVDYIGDINEFQMNLREHTKIADYFGYRISVHSGSDKFRIFPAVEKETKKRFHLKTSGTSYLEALRVIASEEPELYRKIHQAALKKFDEAKKYYEVHCVPSRVTVLSDVSDDKLSEYLEQDDARQLLHITYGAILKDDQTLHEELYQALHRHEEEYKKGVQLHFERHLRALGFIQ